MAHSRKTRDDYYHQALEKLAAQSTDNPFGGRNLQQLQAPQTAGGPYGGFDPAFSNNPGRPGSTFNRETGATFVAPNISDLARPGGNRGTFIGGVDRGVRMERGADGQATHPLYASPQLAPGMHGLDANGDPASRMLDPQQVAEDTRHVLRGAINRNSPQYREAMADNFRAQGRQYNQRTGKIEDVGGLTGANILARHDSELAEGRTDSAEPADPRQVNNARRALYANARRYGLINDDQAKEIADIQGVRKDKGSILYIPDEAYQQLKQMTAARAGYPAGTPDPRFMPRGSTAKTAALRVKLAAARQYLDEERQQEAQIVDQMRDTRRQIMGGQQSAPTAPTATTAPAAPTNQPNTELPTAPAIGETNV